MREVQETGEDPCLHRRSRGHREDSQSPEGKRSHRVSSIDPTAATYFDSPVLFTEPSRFVHTLPDAAAMKDYANLITPILQNAETPFFDEDFYLAKYPDVARAVQEGRVASGWRHYLLYGINERRKLSAD